METNSIKELLKTGVNVTIAISLGDLRVILHEAIEDTKRELEEIVLSDKAETYPSQKQVADILGVNLSTLWLWNKKGYLTHLEVGGKRKYKMSDVKSLLTKKG